MSAIPVDVIAKQIDDLVDAVGSHAMVVNAIFWTGVGRRILCAGAAAAGSDSAR